MSTVEDLLVCPACGAKHPPRQVEDTPTGSHVEDVPVGSAEESGEDAQDSEQVQIVKQKR